MKWRVWTRFQRPEETPWNTTLLLKPIPDKTLFLYLAVSDHTLSAALVREEESTQLPIYYVSKRLLDAKTWYTNIEKLALALMIASRKLHPYFYSHTIEVLTIYPLKQVLQKPDSLSWLLKWAIELGQLEINFRPRTAIKGQAVANFIDEFALSKDEKDRPASSNLNLLRWKLYTNGSSNINWVGAGIVLEGLTKA